METVFLFCFVFGALFTVASALLGFAGSAFSHLPGVGHGHEIPAAHASHGHIHLSHAQHLHVQANGGVDAHDLAVGHGHSATHLSEHVEQTSIPPFFSRLPLLNVSSLLAFLTAFGAAGFILMRFAGWSPLGATLVALVPGVAADVLLALLLGTLLAGETVMRPIDYELQGTVGRVTISIPAGGVGEVVFSKGGTRRSEAARSLGAKAIAYDSEVVIIDYERGTALVQPYEEFVSHYERELPTGEKSAS